MTDSIPQGHGGKRTGAGRKPKAASPVQPTIEIDYNQARARREEALASLAEIELQVKRNELIPADAVQQYWEGMVSRMRGKMLNLPGRLAAATMGCETIQEAEREAMLLVRECLFEIAECGVPK